MYVTLKGGRKTETKTAYKKVALFSARVGELQQKFTQQHFVVVKTHFGFAAPAGEEFIRKGPYILRKPSTMIWVHDFAVIRKTRFFQQTNKQQAVSCACMYVTVMRFIFYS